MTSLTHTSLALYQFMCQHIVGTEKTVKTKRILNNAKDSISSKYTQITSGSFGEGLEMKGCDFDIMRVLPHINIHETYDNYTFDPGKTTFVMIQIKQNWDFPGYALLAGNRHSRLQHAYKKEMISIFLIIYLNRILQMNFYMFHTDHLCQT